MSVAKSYVNCQTLGDIFYENGRPYINILYNGREKKVRWYNDTPKEKKSVSNANSSFTPPIDENRKLAHDVFGFGEENYITIFKGDTYSQLEWFRSAPTRYARPLGWYLPSTIEMPEDLPEEITPVRLDWDKVSCDGAMLMEDKVAEVVASLIYEEKGSFVGDIGDKIQATVTVTRTNICANNYGGNSIMYEFKDEDDNIYLWTTASNFNLKVDNTYHIKGTIKNHKSYKGQKETILTRVRAEEA